MIIDRDHNICRLPPGSGPPRPPRHSSTSKPPSCSQVPRTKSSGLICQGQEKRRVAAHLAAARRRRPATCLRECLAQVQRRWTPPVTAAGHATCTRGLCSSAHLFTLYSAVYSCRHLHRGGLFTARFTHAAGTQARRLFGDLMPSWAA